jgi:hypothetical protein
MPLGETSQPASRHDFLTARCTTHLKSGLAVFTFVDSPEPTFVNPGPMAKHSLNKLSPTAIQPGGPGYGMQLSSCT